MASPAQIEALADGQAAMAIIARCETRIERSLFRAMTGLERRQVRRAGEAVTAPVLVAVDHENCETKPIPPPAGLFPGGSKEANLSAVTCVQPTGG